MNKRTIDPFDYANVITKANPKGILFTTKADDEVNTMVIGWGLIGTLWGLPTFTAFIRTSRHSYDLVEKSGEFTINVAPDGMTPEVFRVAGSKSGRHMNKIDELGLTLVEPSVIATPGIAELPLTLECKVMYKQMLDKNAVPIDVQERFYPESVTDIDAGGSCYYHMVYYGQIVAAYIIE